MGGNITWLNQPLQMWIKESQLRPYPLPPRLNCRDCTRSESATSEKETLRWKQYKCCTFQPFVPNFLLGSMLESSAMPIAKQAVISPLGLCPTPEYREKFFATEDHERGEELKCAFYNKEAKACSVWKSRPSECSVFFCQDSAFYRARSSDLFEWEIAVAQMACLEFGYTNKEVDTLMAWMDSDDAESLESRWKHFAGREAEFFAKTWTWTQTLKGPEIYSWLSTDVQARFDSWVRFA
jgi:Fe-S-cluster containining protein